MATLIIHGKANVNGVVGSFDVILYPIAQNARVNHNFELEIVKDNLGQDCSWLSRNEFYENDWGVKFLGDTAAHAKVGAAFFAPLAVMTLSGADISAFNGTWILTPSSDINLKNDQVADGTFKCRKYADATQNTLAATTPS